MFNGFNAYDDEGYFLITLTEYLAGQPLFTQAWPVYGPFYYEVVGGLFKLLGVLPGHDSGRFLTIAIWLIASLIGGLAAFRLTRNAWLGIAAEFVTFRALTALVNEPLHASGLAAVLLVSLVVTATFRAARPRVTAALIGAMVGALCLVKINVGVFAGIAVAFAWAGSLSQPWRRIFLPSMAVLVAALPLVLMSGLLSHAWVLEFAVVEVFSGAALGAAIVMATPRPLPAPSAKWLTTGGAVLVVASVGAALAQGTRLENLLNGTFLQPLRVPQLFNWPLTIGTVNVLWAAVGLVAAIAICGPFGRAVSLPVAGLVRVLAGAATWLSVILLPSSTFLLALPLAWIATQAPRGEEHDSANPYSRLVVPALAILESLQAYPIAGTQQWMASLGLVPLGAIILSDGLRQLRLANAARPAPFGPDTWVPGAAVLINIAFFLLFGFVAIAGFARGTPLDLRGAQLVRVPADQGAQMRALVAAIDRDCSSFITLPGMDSFYIWTAQSPPAEVTAEGWWYVLNRQEQQALLQQVEPKQRLCVVKNQRVIEFWGRQVPQLPLAEFIDREFVRAGSYGDYDLLVRVNSPLP